MFTRFGTKLTAALNTAAATTAEIPYSDMSGGSILVPSGSSITTLTWYAAMEQGGTYGAALDETGVAVTQTVDASAAAKVLAIPDALFGSAAIKAVVNAAGSVTVHLKA